MTSKVKVISQTVGVEGQSLKELVVASPVKVNKGKPVIS